MFLVVQLFVLHFSCICLLFYFLILLFWLLHICVKSSLGFFRFKIWLILLFSYVSDHMMWKYCALVHDTFLIGPKQFFNLSAYPVIRESGENLSLLWQFRISGHVLCSITNVSILLCFKTNYNLIKINLKVTIHGLIESFSWFRVYCEKIVLTVESSLNPRDSRIWWKFIFTVTILDFGSCFMFYNRCVDFVTF